MRRCKQCIMPNTYPGISFNDEGTCSFCLQYRPANSYLGKDELLRLIKSVNYKGQYDCVIPLSGGKDSTFILYYCVRELGLRPIAANYDSGFQSKIAKNNMKTTCDTLNVPLILRGPKGDIQKRMLREILLVSEALGCFVRTCLNCGLMLRTVALNIAREYNVPFVLWGSTPLESVDYSDYKAFRYGMKRLEILASIKVKFKMLQLTLRKIAGLVPRLIMYMILNVRQRLQMDVPIKYALDPFGTIQFPESAPTVIHFFDYIRWDSLGATRLLKEKLGWKHPENMESRFDCLLHCFAEHKSLKLYGISGGGTINCNFVREKMMSREDALKKENATRESVEKECREIINLIGLKDFKMPNI